MKYYQVLDDFTVYNMYSSYNYTFIRDELLTVSELNKLNYKLYGTKQDILINKCIRNNKIAEINVSSKNTFIMFGVRKLIKS